MNETNLKNLENKKKMNMIFEKFDNGKKGYLEKDEVVAVLAYIYKGFKFSDSDVDKIITEADKNGDGKIQLEEYLANNNFKNF